MNTPIGNVDPLTRRELPEVLPVRAFVLFRSGKADVIAQKAVQLVRTGARRTRRC